MITGSSTYLSSTEACVEAGITYRQLDWWISHDSIPVTPEMRSPGSGKYRLIPAWYVPRLRLLGRIQQDLRSGAQGGLAGPALRAIFDAYEDGTVRWGWFAMTWDVET